MPNNADCEPTYGQNEADPKEKEKSTTAAEWPLGKMGYDPIQNYTLGTNIGRSILPRSEHWPPS